MLPSSLRALRNVLDVKGYLNRTPWEDDLLAELNEIDKVMDPSDPNNRKFIEGMEKTGHRHSTNIWGPATDSCPTCGRGL